MPPKRTRKPTPEKQVEAAATELSEIAARITDEYLKAAKVVGRMTTFAGTRELRSLLVSRAGLAPEDAAALLGLTRIPERHEVIKDSKLSPGAIKALVDAEDDIREQVFRLLERGQKVTAKDIAQIEARSDADLLSDTARAAVDRMSFLTSMATDAASASIAAFQERVDQLAELVQQFIGDYVEANPEDWNPFRTDEAGYHWTHEEVSRTATSVLQDFERLFGDGASARAGMGTEAIKLWWAEKALRRFATGNFAHEGGLSFREEDAGHTGPGLVEALSYLGTPDPVDQQQAYRRPPHLRVLELRAGGGGTAIGLMAAGFAHAALYESVLKRVKTLRFNWPDWDVRHADLADVSESEFEQYRGVDLVAGNPFVRKGAAKNRFREMTTAVRTISPRAFVFEAAIKQKQKSRELTFAAAETALSELGYRVSRHLINCKDFGLPQDRERMFIVGLRNDVPGVFAVPHLEKPIIRTVSRALGPSIVRHLTPENVRANIEKDSQQDIYNRWAGYWLHLHMRHILPTIVSQDGEAREEWIRSWKEKGFRITKIRETPPAVHEVNSIDFVPEMTFEALALAQGYPAGWKFLASGDGNVSMIGESLPPVVAKAVGLALRTCLTGEEFDLRKSLLEPIIDPERIGKGHRRLRTRRNLPVDMATRVLAGEPIDVVQRNHMRRKILKYTIAVIESYRAHEEQVETHWEETLFPDGLPD
ncbi:DNA cytosine methyltransferase [Rhizobium leguminosarum]|uniref:DNA cytosine methyltransferase n=1 Tax=Rhizobium leguminosarum TaxID=384 RepID=UPI000401E258|nr:DNA cytosine methyltransferase [Rhizobium leguminosarum]